MARTLRCLGFLNKDAHPTPREFIFSLPFLYGRTDIQFVMDARVFGLLVNGWIQKGSFDFFRSMDIYITKYWPSLTLPSLTKRLPTLGTQQQSLLTGLS